MGIRNRGGAGKAQPAASLLEISRVLEETARLVRQHAGADDPPAPAPRLTAPKVRAILALRWLRGEYLGFDASDAAWSMLLELYAAHLEGRRLHQTRLGIAAGVPATTALNATRRLLECGLFTRAADPDDRRLILLGLSDNAADRMAAYLAAADRVALLFA